MLHENIFKKIVHLKTAKEFDLGYILESNYIETMDLDGPKLMLKIDDPDGYHRDFLNLRELDEIETHISDDWSLDGMNVKQKFTLLADPNAGQLLKLNLIAQPMYKIKTILPQTRIFRQRGMPEIIGALSQGTKVDGSGFPVVEDYHFIAGERPSATFKQMANEQGAHIWLGRDGWKVKTFAKLFAQEPSFEYHHNKSEEEYQIYTYKKMSRQNQLQEQNIRSYTSWNDEKGRINTPANSAGLSKAKTPYPWKASSQNIQTLANLPATPKIAIDFVCDGNGFITPGMTLKILWHQQDPAIPLNESLPDKIVVYAVAHYYSAQKYLCRVKGAVPFEPTS